MPPQNAPGSNMNDEDTITALLGKIQPRPSPRFYHKMAASPWQRSGAARVGRRRWQVAVALGLLVVFLIFSPWISPPLNTLANKLLQFFTLAGSDSTTIQVTIPSPAGPDVLNPETDFTLSLDDVQRLVDFYIKTPAEMPEDYGFHGAHFNEEKQEVAFYYKGDGRGILVVQQPIGNYYEKIGASAEVEAVQVGGFGAEYVVGGWVFDHENEQRLETAPVGTQVAVDAYWDANISRQTLRWQEDGIQFEVISWGKLDKEIFINLAASMQ
jgi:hypothetical protein